jgi:XLF-Cernunnos, XRcc4-like factor, NHEJ component
MYIIPLSIRLFFDKFHISLPTHQKKKLLKPCNFFLGLATGFYFSDMRLEKEKSDLLATLPWSPLIAPSAQKFQIKRLFGQDYYLVLVTDFRNVWLEHAKATDIYERALENEIAIVKPDAESSPALIKILATFLDHVQKVTESSDKVSG